MTHANLTGHVQRTTRTDCNRQPHFEARLRLVRLREFARSTIDAAAKTRGCFHYGPNSIRQRPRRTKRRLRLPLSGVNGARARAAPSRAQHIRDAKPGLLSKCLAVVGGTPRGKCGSKCNSSGEAVCNGATHMLCGTEHGCACVRRVALFRNGTAREARHQRASQ